LLTGSGAEPCKLIPGKRISATYLSAILLGGLLLNAIAGWWWADPMAALVMVPIIAKEGWTDYGGRRVATIVDADES
jgi:divalent metal cation (Fe/Co/Zn/Cd) transporter